MKTHKLKLNIKFCDEVLSGAKTFEIRKNDRGFQTGDLINFTPVDNNGEEGYHKVQNQTYKITYILDNWGLKEGYVALAIREVKENDM